MARRRTGAWSPAATVTAPPRHRQPQDVPQRKPALARLDVRVPVELRRQRGSAPPWSKGAAPMARANGRTELAGMDETPVRHGFVDATGPFARHLGFTVVQRWCVAASGCRSTRLTRRDCGSIRDADTARLHTAYLGTIAGPTSTSRTAASSGVACRPTYRRASWSSMRRCGTPPACEPSKPACKQQNRAKVTTAARHDATGEPRRLHGHRHPARCSRVGLAARHPRDARAPRSPSRLRRQGRQLVGGGRAPSRRPPDQHVERRRERAHDRGQRRHGLRGRRPSDYWHKTLDPPDPDPGPPGYTQPPRA